MTHPRRGISRLTPSVSLLLLCLASAALFTVRASAPHNFLDKDQERPASYILDAVLNGHWICQTDWMGDITSKPPLLTWIGASLIRCFGMKPWVFFIPSAMAWTVLAITMYFWIRRYFGENTALFSGLSLILSPLGMRLFMLLRTDALFGFTVALTAVCAWHAWRNGRGWLGFWVAAAAATLTKGPLGLLLGVFGLAAALWDRPVEIRALVCRQQLWGLALYVILVGGWFVAAYHVWGEPLAEKLIRRELIAHAAHVEHPDPWFVRLPKPTLYFLHRMLPWSLLALAGLRRAVRHPATDLSARRLERFLLGWFLLGLALFSITHHQRGDLLAPILAPGVVFAARELSDWLARWRIRAAWIAVIIIVAGTAQAFHYYHFVEAQNPLVRSTESIRHFAARWSQQRNVCSSLQFVDVPYTLQLYLGTMRTNIPTEAATAQLAGNEPACIAVSRKTAANLQRQLRNRNKSIFELAVCENELFPFVILGNFDPQSVGAPDEE